MSKKLEGNGRWESSRMMLPEHREQYLAQRKPKPADTFKAQVPTEEELKLIRDFVLLPIMLTIVDKNRTEIELSSYSLKNLYVAASLALMTRIHSDLVSVKKTLKERNIKVFEEERADSAIRYRFNCRGYENQFAMMRDVVRAEISVRISRYVAGMFK